MFWIPLRYVRAGLESAFIVVELAVVGQGALEISSICNALPLQMPAIDMLPNILVVKRCLLHLHLQRQIDVDAHQL